LTGIHDEAGELYGTLEPADAAPTRAQSAVAAKLEEEFHEAFERWEKLLSADIPKLNGRLKAAGVSELKPDTKPNQPDEAEEADLD
jgi:cytochrome c-type biogenesis protein CcmH/NrfG